MRVPFLPSTPVKASAPTKGGTIRGRVVRSVKTFFPEKSYLVMMYATGIPIADVVASVRKAQMMLFCRPLR